MDSDLNRRVAGGFAGAAPALKRFGQAMQSWYDLIEREATARGMTVEQYIEWCATVLDSAQVVPDQTKGAGDG